MDDEHGGFFLGVYGLETSEFVLEIDKDLTLFGVFGENEHYTIKLEDLESSKPFFKLLLSGMMGNLREEIKKQV